MKKNSSNSNNSSIVEGDDDGGNAIVRVKPLGAGGGGVERSGIGMVDGQAGLRYHSAEKFGDGGGGRIDLVAGNFSGKTFNYMNHVIPPETDNEKLYNFFLPRRIDAFMDGYNVNLMAYGQTGTGKTHTMFGTPGIMERAGRGDYGTSVNKDYGIFPRALLEIFARYKKLSSQSSDKNYILTAHSIELSMLFGNQDMLNRKGGNPKLGSMMGRATQFGVCIDRVSKPARMYGMEELILESDKDLFRFFSGISERCTVGTGLNQYSSRSHCFVVLILYCYDSTNDTISTSRFQFVDMAGSEKIKDAHGDSDYRNSGASIGGMLVNYSLTMLGCAVRDLLASRKSRKKFSFRAYLFDLVMLLSQSLTGEALTAVFVCVSQAPANAATTYNALQFGKLFGQLTLRKKKVKAIPYNKMFNEVKKLLVTAQKALKNNPPAAYRVQREGQVIDGSQRLEIFKRLKGVCGGGGGGGNLKKK